MDVKLLLLLLLFYAIVFGPAAVHKSACVKTDAKLYGNHYSGSLLQWLQ